MPPPDLVVVNIRGGAPPGLVARAFRELPAFASLSARGEVFSRVYGDQAHAAGGFDALLTGTPSTLYDRVHLPWAGRPRPERTIFHAFRRAGYATHVRGAFGLDPTLNPHAQAVQPRSARHALRDFGVDEFSEADAAFDVRRASAVEDARAFDEVDDLLRRSERRPCVVWVNLQGCADALRCAYSAPASRCSIRCWDWDDCRVDAAPVSGAAAADVDQEPALTAAARCFRAARGGGGPVASEEVQHALSTCWNCICDVAGRLAPLLKRSNTVVVLLADSGFEVFDHRDGLGGELLPWDASLRGFVAIAPARADLRGSRCDLPQSLCALYATIAEACRLAPSADDGVRRAPAMRPGISHGAITLSLPLTMPQLARFVGAQERTFRCFFVRGVVAVGDGVRSVVVWFSLDHIERCTRGPACKNPALGVPLAELRDAGGLGVSVFDLLRDGSETRDLLQEPEWSRGSECFELKARFDDALVHAGRAGFVHFDAGMYLSAPPAPGLAHEAHAARVPVSRDAESQTDTPHTVVAARFGGSPRCADVHAVARCVTVLAAAGEGPPPPVLAGRWSPQALLAAASVLTVDGRSIPVQARKPRAATLAGFRVLLATHASSPVGDIYLCQREAPG